MKQKIGVSTDDPGKDGDINQSKTTADGFGMTLGYFNGDFNRTGSSFNSNLNNSPSPYSLFDRSLYNGNISTWATNHTYHPATNGVDPYFAMATAETYHYDELNRITSSSYNYFDGINYTSANNDYNTDYSYDANGNMLTLNRNGYQNNSFGAPLQMDMLNYHYQQGTNKLIYVDDQAPPQWSGDIKTQQPNNYTY
ncbi:MAG: hypothetical protein RL065_1009, partial [Bacteroidota bacterium]